MRRFALALLAAAGAAGAAPGDPMETLAGFQRGPFEEQVRLERTVDGIRVFLGAPARPDPTRPTRIVVYATPNGNTLEQTLGAAPAPARDWHLDIQHVAAQVRRLREVDPDENVTLVCIQAEEKSWPAWRQKHPDGGPRLRALVEDCAARFPGRSRRVALTGHSGGGSFLFNFLNGGPAVPAYVERIAFLDANYSYSDTDGHGDKLLAWLGGDRARRLAVVAYDDRRITLDGKRVVSETGGTFRASQRMLDRFRQDGPVAERTAGDVTTYTARGGQITVAVDANPQNKILHTALVGERNGLLYALTLGTPAEGRWGAFGAPRAYTKWVQPAPFALAEAPAAEIPARPVDAPGGAAFMERIADLAPDAREAALLAELGRGNVPEFLRRFRTVTARAAGADGKEHTALYRVAPDYVAVGSDADWVRAPMTPMTAQRLADRFGCLLTTRKMADDVYAQATVRLEPKPLTVEREAVRTFVQHHRLIEEQRAGKPLGELVAGIKKDVVITNRLGEKPHRVAIYGWHLGEGRPIQPLTIIHRDTYVDYSHGVRLVHRTALVDGRPMPVAEALRDPNLAPLFSDEGVIERSAYPLE